jgi:hypothetical protein
MNPYSHHVSGFFAVCDEARDTLAMLVARGLPPAQLRIYETDIAPLAPVPTQDSNAVLKDVLVDGAIGTAVGTGLGALGEIALVAANVTLFVASPLIAPLAMLGWGAAIGGVIGATAGATADPPPAAGAADGEKKEGWLSDMVRDAVSSGQIVLVAETRTAQETAIAREVIEASVGGSRDVNTA